MKLLHLVLLFTLLLAQKSFSQSKVKFHLSIGPTISVPKTSVIRRCQRYIKDQDAAQDVSQEVFLRVLLKIPGFKGNASFATWLHTIIHNRCIDHIRKDKKAMDLEISEHIAESLQEEWDTDAAEEPTVEILETLMEQISGAEKYLLLLKYKEGWSTRQIQQATGLPESIIKNRLYRTKQKLRKLLG